MVEVDNFAIGTNLEINRWVCSCGASNPDTKKMCVMCKEKRNI